MTILNLFAEKYYTKSEVSLRRKIVLYDKHEISRAALKTLISTNADYHIVGEAGNDGNIYKILKDTTPEILVINLMYLQCISINQVKQVKKTFPGVNILAISALKENKNHTIRLIISGISGLITAEDGCDDLMHAIKIVGSGKKFINPRINSLIYDYLTKDQEEESHECLSDREYEIFFFLAQGESISTIAKHLNISEKTVSTYKGRMMEKMKFDTIADLIRYAFENDLLLTKK